MVIGGLRNIGEAVEVVFEQGGGMMGTFELSIEAKGGGEAGVAFENKEVVVLRLIKEVQAEETLITTLDHQLTHQGGKAEDLTNGASRDGGRPLATKSRKVSFEFPSSSAGRRVSSLVTLLIFDRELNLDCRGADEDLMSGNTSVVDES
jgi:hypothetical protein